MKFPVHIFTFTLFIALVFASIGLPISLSADPVFDPKYQGIDENSVAGYYYIQSQSGVTVRAAEPLGNLGRSNSTGNTQASSENKFASNIAGNGAPSVEPTDKSNMTQKSTTVKCEG